jgi:hypothetical protein
VVLLRRKNLRSVEKMIRQVPRLEQTVIDDVVSALKEDAYNIDGWGVDRTNLTEFHVHVHSKVEVVLKNINGKRYRLTIEKEETKIK